MGLDTGGRKYAFVFVCQGGELEVKALLLAASMRLNLRCRYELVAAVPEQYAAPASETLRLLDRMGVRTAPIRNELALDYPIGNKLSCMRLPVDADKLVFVDSDILCVQPFFDEDRFGIAFNAKPADNQTFTRSDADWRAAYGAVGLEPPTLRFPTTVSAEYGYPYFNAGFVAVNTDVPLGDVWLECCRKIDADPAVPNKRPWLDQIGLPVALQQLDVPFDCLDERYNFPASFRPVRYDRLPIFCHYHSPDSIRDDLLLRDFVTDLLEHYPGLADVLRDRPRWQDLPRRVARRHRTISTTVRHPPDLVVTGIPDSGMTELVRELRLHSNCVVIEDPPEILSPLQTQEIPRRIASYYRAKRASLREPPLRGEPLAGDDFENGPEVARISTDDFVLGTSNTVGYLSRLRSVRRAMPWARVAICVRDPFETIAAWKTGPASLRDADVDAFEIGSPQDTWLTARQHRELRLVAKLARPSERRAALWRYFAEVVLEEVDLGGIVLVPHAALVRNPEEESRRVLASFDGGERSESPAPRQRIADDDVFLDDDDDAQAIRAICSDAAAALGLMPVARGDGA